MKILLLVFALFVGLNSFAQSKKERIAILTFRLDSLNREFVKDTVELGNKFRSNERDYSNLLKELNNINAQINDKSKTINSKSNTIKSLNAKNTSLRKRQRQFRHYNNSIKSEIREFERIRDSIVKVREQMEANDYPFELRNITNPPAWVRNQNCLNCILLPCQNCQPILILNQGRGGQEYAYLESSRKVYKIPIESKNVEQNVITFIYEGNSFYINVRMFPCPYENQYSCGEITIYRDGEVVFYSNQISTAR